MLSWTVSLDSKCYINHALLPSTSLAKYRNDWFWDVLNHLWGKDVITFGLLQTGFVLLFHPKSIYHCCFLQYIPLCHFYFVKIPGAQVSRSMMFWLECFFFKPSGLTLWHQWSFTCSQWLFGKNLLKHAKVEADLTNHLRTCCGQ